MADHGTGVIVRDVNGNTLTRIDDIGATVDPFAGIEAHLSDSGENLVITVVLAEGGEE